MIDLAIPAFPFPRRIKPPLIALIIIQINIYLGLFFTMTDTLALARLVTATSMLVTDVGDRLCWWQKVWNVDDRFQMLVTDSLHSKSHHKNNFVTEILKLLPS